MILQSLSSYYQRLSTDSNSNIPKIGYGIQKIHFALVLSKVGVPLNFIDLRVNEGNKSAPRILTLPKHFEERSGSTIAPNFMFDNSGYVLGIDGKGKPDRSKATFEAFRDYHKSLLSDTDDAECLAVVKFLDGWKPDDLKNFDYHEDIVDSNIVFMIDGQRNFVHEKTIINDIWRKEYLNNQSKNFGQCLVMGNSDVGLARIHPKLKGVQGGKSAGASIVSFNDDAYESYAKKQSFNAPVSEKAAFSYTTALNHLLARGSRQKVQIGDATTVFWADKPTKVESLLAGILDPNIEESLSDSLANDLKIYLKAVSQGTYPIEFKDQDTRFYILGLSPNAARISVRFWYVSTVLELSKHIGSHFKNMEIITSSDKDARYPAIWQLLRETATQGESKNISPVLSGSLMRSILTGTPYPRSLLTILIGRIRAEQSRKSNIGKTIPNINYLRAAMIKAYLIRNHNMEVTVKLDKESTNTGYLLGRLFCVLEKAQEEAVNSTATIKDRFYGSASATPAKVFPILMRGVQNNISKLRKGAETGGRAVNFDKLISEIAGGLDAFPKTLSLEDQGMFALGYYHQRQDFFTKKS